jgi:hypothetical protein
MAKESGLGMTCSIDDSGGTARAISNDITELQIGTPNNLQDITGLDKSAIERLILLSDGQVSVTSVFNDASVSSFIVFKVRTGTRTVTIAHSGQTLAMEMLISACDMNRQSDGSFIITATLELQSGTVPTWA